MKTKYTHIGKYYGIEVYYNIYKTGDDWLKGTTILGHWAVMFLFIMDWLVFGKVIIYDLKKL